MQKICVIGAGTMGGGIAHVFAIHGYSVSLVDVSEARLISGFDTIRKNLSRQVAKQIISEGEKDKALEHIQTYVSIAEGVKSADLVIEAATENIGTKKQIFEKIDAAAPEGAILATNTSSISITELSSSTQRPECVIGMHFMNPVPIMKLVEVIRGYQTTDSVCSQIIELSRAIGKDPVLVNDYPGFVANRILMPMINEAIYTLYEGVSGVEEIDTVMRLGMAHPMGPLQLADFIGLDVCLAILRVLHEGFGNTKYAPCPLLANMVAAGKLGVKTGEGFYTYRSGYKDFEVSTRYKKF